MVFLSVTVVLGSSGCALLPWEIFQCHSEATTVREFFKAAISPRIRLDDSKIVDVFVGPVQDRLFDRVSIDLPVAPIILQFGKYMKVILVNEQSTEQHGIERGRSAFEVMEQARRERAQKRCPLAIEPKNRKDKLFNDFTAYCEGEHLGWSGDEVETFGVTFMKSVCDVLWYIDGHHNVLASRACPVPEVFSRFQGYNAPELSKHRKRASTNICTSTLEALSSKLFRVLQSSFIQRPRWLDMKANIESLAHSLSKYVEYLRDKSKSMKIVHSSSMPWRTLSKGLDIFYLQSINDVKDDIKILNSRVLEEGPYKYIDLSEYSPSDPKKKFLFLKEVKRGLTVPTVNLVYSAGNNVGNFHYLWHVPDISLNDAIKGSQVVIEEIKEKLPVFHSRVMKKEFVDKFGKITNAVKPAVLRYFYQDLTGHSGSSETSDQHNLDLRMMQAFEIEDADIVTDLRHLNTGASGRFDVFWVECSKFLEQDIGTAVDDRRHTEVTHIATAISFCDLRDQVAARCPEKTAVPSVEWLRLQFWPKTPSTKASLHHTGHFKIRCRVQQRQWRKEHPDTHYAAGIFRYQREYAVMVKEHCQFLCLDDKHRIKVGEPGVPVAAAERGRRVLTAVGTRFLVADHDFTCFSIIPSVILDIDIPEDISGSWYTGQVYAGFKDASLEPSSPMRHMSEAFPLTLKGDESKPILFIFPDGGPDHRLTHISVQLSLIAMFLNQDLDYLCAARTAPYHSWRNPVERIMSIINLGLQCVGLARKEMGSEYERMAARCNSVKDVRKLAEMHPRFAEAIVDSIEPVKIQLTQVLQRLKLKGKQFIAFNSASQQDLDEFAKALLLFDQSFNLKIKKAEVGKFPRLKFFYEHCCRERHYFFDILKCGSPDCGICKPVRLPYEVFQKLHHLPDPTPGPDGHFKPFESVLGTATVEDYRPSLQSRKKKKTLPFIASVQHVKNVDMMLQCDECGLWRLLYSKKKLKLNDRQCLERELDGLMFTCGSSLEDLALSDPLNEVYVRSNGMLRTNRKAILLCRI